MTRILVAVMAIIIALIFRNEAAGYPRVAAQLPQLITSVIIGLALLAIVQQLLAWRQVTEGADRYALTMPGWPRVRDGSVFVGLVLLYAWAITSIGYLIATPVFLLSSMLVAKATKPWIIVLTATVVTLAIWIIFVNFLRLPIPLFPRV